MKTRPWLLGLLGLIGAVNLALLLTPFLMDTWDGETHLFFADHYLRGWFDPWEEKWFEGFWVFSYPPLTHQLIAIFSLPIGIEAGYRLVQGLALLAWPFSTWVFTRELTDRCVADWAAIVAASTPGIFSVLYSFGQLPSFVAMPLTMMAATFLVRYLRRGDSWDLAAWTLFAGAAAATHHHTVFLVLPLLAVALVGQVWQSQTWSVRSLPGHLVRPVIAAGLFVTALIVVNGPFWWWFLSQNLPQVEIPHPTRDQLFASPGNANLFFFNIYGSLIFLLPVLFWRTLKHRVIWFVGIAILLLVTLGLGNLTPLPRLVFGAWASTLTYERFSVWAAALLAIPAATALTEAFQRLQARRISASLLLALTTFLVFGGMGRAIVSTLSTRNMPLPLASWQETELVQFLAMEDHAQWNYVTFGLGEAQFARLSRLTTARTVDGTYYTARWRSELRESGIGTLDSTHWFGGRGNDVLFPMLQHPELWSLGWAIVAEDPTIAEHLTNSGWSVRRTLECPSGSSAAPTAKTEACQPVTIWQAPIQVTIPPIIENRIGPPYYPQTTPFKSVLRKLLAYWWGIMPLAFLVGAIGVAYRALRPSGHTHVGRPIEALVATQSQPPQSSAPAALSEPPTLGQDAGANAAVTGNGEE